MNELTADLIRKFELYLVHTRSYCEAVDIEYVEPTLMQFLYASQLTRERTSVYESKQAKQRARPRMAFREYVKQRDAGSIR